MIDLSPSDLGLPSKFSSFRREQLEAIDFTLASSKPFIAESLPTGSGKSLKAVATALLSSSKSVYLTATRGLQSQVGDDFKSVGMVDVRGRANYTCAQFHSLKNRAPATCDYGNDHGCTFANSPTHCLYKKAVQEAEKSPIPSTNYSYWLHSRRQSSTALEDGEPVELLICDEAHAIEQELGRFLQVKISLEDWDPGEEKSISGLVMDEERDRARLCATRLYADLKNLLAKYLTLREAKEDPEHKRISDLLLKFEAVRNMDRNWVWQTDETHITFDPIRPGKYSYLLWSGVPRVLLLSATLRPYVLSLLGIPKTSYDFKEWPSSFPPQYGPIYHIPTVKLSWRSTDEEYATLARRIDGIIESRIDRKGVIHTTSYGRARVVLDRSRYAQSMFYNESGAEATRTVERYRKSAPPAILVSPSFSTGYDFTGDQCEYQIIVKVPFPDTTSRVMAERCKDRDYMFYLAAQQIVQMCGRGRRSATDRCEVFILDNNINFLLGAGKKFFPRDFKMWTVKDIPKPPPKITPKIIK